MTINPSQVVNITFDFKGNKIIVIGTMDEPWFIGNQVTRVLGYKNTRDALHKHVRNTCKTTIIKLLSKGVANVDRGTIFRDTPNTQPHTVLINEPGLYALVMKSKMDKALEFQDWVYSEVPPSIRKTGWSTT